MLRSRVAQGPMARDTITPQQPASGARRRALIAFAAVSLIVATPASPAAAMSVDAVGYSAQVCTMVGGGGADSLGGTADRDVVCGRGGADRIRGNGGHDVLLGGAGGDLLQGRTGSDLLNGGPGNDRAFGGAGADDLQGGPGIDILGGGLGPDELSGGAGRDIVVYGQRGRSVRVSIGAGANDGVAGEGDDVHADVEAVQGGRGNDVLTGNGRSNRLFGGGGNDRLLGRGGSDVLVGGGGDDRLDAREGATAKGGAAQAGSVDRVVCGGGNDTALVDPVDVVDPDCENVNGGAPQPRRRAIGRRRGSRSRTRAWPRTSRPGRRSALSRRATRTPATRTPSRSCRVRAPTTTAPSRSSADAADERGLRLRGQEHVHGPHPGH